MEILDLRHFSAADLRPLLEEETVVWAESLAWDYAGSAELILRYMDAKILPGYAAIERGSLFGYAFFVYEQSKGVIGDLFVRDGGRTANRREVEERLLVHVIETLQQSPGIHRIEAQLLAHLEGEVARPFLAQGFSRHPRVFMNYEMSRNPQTAPKLSPEFEVRPWSEDQYQVAAALITAAYRGHVDSDINDQYRTLSGSLRFMNNIVRFPGCGVFDARASFVVLDRRTRTLVGLILCSQVRADVGHVTQVCVLPEYRSAGLGVVLLAATTRSLRERGFKAISLTVTQANDRAIALYHRIGYDSVRVFDAFVWEG
ncbi:MAG: GNAT family N-acetyltransferase [Terriglobales bacterium]|jgi:ribosomal protein S18 acetylase RimI-like enzyme